MFEKGQSQMNRLAKYTIAVAVCCGSAAGAAWADAGDLQRSLAAIDMQRSGVTTPSEKLEAECLALLEGSRTPEEKGMIYAEIAVIYAQNGMSAPDKTVEYCRRALELPLELTKRCQVYVFWADALEVKHRAALREKSGETQREVATVCLRGLNTILDHRPPQTAQTVPVVHKFDCPPDDPAYQELVRRSQEEIAAREQVMRQNDLVLYRGMLIEKLLRLQREMGGGETELETLARDVLDDPQKVREVVDLVRLQAQRASSEVARPEDAAASGSAAVGEAAKSSEETKGTNAVTP